MKNTRMFLLFKFLLFVLVSNTVDAYGKAKWDNGQTPSHQNPQISSPCRSFGPPAPGQMRSTYTLGLLAYDSVEVLDYAGPFEVFAITGEMFNRIKVVTVATKRFVTAMNGFRVVVDRVIGQDDFSDINILVVPGTNTNFTVAAINNAHIMNWIKKVARRADYIISVCTGAMILGRAGLVDGLDITSHAGVLDILPDYAPRSNIFSGRRFTDNGRVLTSAGISAGIDVSFYFVKRMFGKAISDAIAERMEYDWKDWNYDTCRGPTLPNQGRS